MATRVEAAYDKHLAKAGSTDERDAAYRAYVERVSSAWKDAPPTSPPELLLAPGRILARHQPDPGREIASRPEHRRVRRRRHDRGRPQNPDARDGFNPLARLVRAMLHLDPLLDRPDQRPHGLELRRQHDDARPRIDRQPRVLVVRHDREQFREPGLALRRNGMRPH